MAPAFRFQTILEFRKRTEDERQMELAKALQAATSLRDRLETMQSERARVAADLQTTLHGPLDISDVELRYRYLGSLDEQVIQLAQMLADAEEEVLQQRIRLADAMKDRKTIEKLKENDREKYRNEHLQKEQKEVDELNVTRRSRQL